MKTVILYFAFLVMLAFSFLQAYSQTAGKLTLRKAVETGIANNPDVQQTGLVAKTEEINWKQAKLNRFPDLNGTASNGINQGRSIDPFTNTYINQQVNYANYGLSSGVTLFSGFTLQNAVKQNALIYQAAKMDLQQAIDNLTIDIILAYLQVLSNEDMLQQLQNQAALSKKDVERLEILDRDGAIAPSQLSDIRGQYANDQLAILSTQNALETSKLLLSQLMNVPYDKQIQLERLDAESFIAKYEDTPDNIYKAALEKFSLVKAVELRRQGAEKGVKLARGGLYPTLSLNGNLNTNYSNAAFSDIFINTTDVTTSDYVIVNGTPTPVIRQKDNFRSEKISYSRQLNNNLFTSVSLNLRIPLFNSLQARNRVKLAQITLKDNKITEVATKTRVQQSIEQAYINMTTASERYKVLLMQVDAFTESFRAATIRFNAGLGTSIDYLTAKNNLDRAKINLITARYDYVLRTRILDYYQGKPLW